MRAAQAALLLFFTAALLAWAAAQEAGGGGREEPVVQPPDIRPPARPCDRARSQHARLVVQEIILPAAKALGYALPSECPLAPELDRFLPQERAKTQLRSGHWKCEFCSKVFLSQPYLDGHMDARHADMLPPPHRSTCLADYADLLHARRFEAWAARQAGWASDPMPCNRAAAARRQQECAELAERCFPRGAGKQARALNDLLGSLCKAHTCDVRRKRRLLQAAAEGRQRWRAGWTALAVAVVLVVALFYWLLLAVTRGPRGRKAHTT